MRRFHRSRSYAPPTPLLTRVWWLGWAGLVASIASYLWYMNATIFMAAREQKAAAAVTALESTVTVLEERYLSIQETLTKDKAVSLGLREADRGTIFAARAPSPAQTARLDIPAN